MMKQARSVLELKPADDGRWTVTETIEIELGRWASYSEARRAYKEASGDA
jgi:hypothetical protein